MAAARAGVFDLILMDVQMPVMDGVTATRAIRSLDPPVGRVPIIGLTANVSGEDRRACLASGMDAVLAKPCSMDALSRALALHQAPPAQPAAA